RQAAIAAVGLRRQELGAGSSSSKRFEFGNLMRQAPYLGFIHLHRSQLDRLRDRDAADVIDRLFAILDRPASQFLERLSRGRDCFVGAGELSVTSAGGGAAVGGSSLASHLLEDLRDNAANEFFVDLHGIYSCFTTG